jgi:hypothetical protein
MKNRINIVCIIFITLINLTACDKVSQQISDIIKKPSPIEIATRIEALTDDNKPSQAIDIGESYLKANSDSADGLVNYSLARAYMFLGDVTSAAKYTKDAIDIGLKANNQDTKTISTERKDKRQIPEEPNSQGSISVPGASIENRPNETVLKAGDITLTIPK